MSTPKVSIIIPTFNRSQLLLYTLKSLIKQSFKSWECLIIDDGSQDGTEEMVKKFFGKDSRIKFFLRPGEIPKGPAGCRNFGLKKSIGEYIQWLDDDDLLSKFKLEKQLIELEAHHENFVAICDWDYYWEGKARNLQNCFGNERIIEVDGFYEKLYREQSFVPLHAFMYSKKLCLKAGSWNSNLTFNDDAEYITRVLLNSNGIINVKDCYVLYRNHSGTRVSRKMEEDSLRSSLESLSLISSHLQLNGIKATNFFKWKLLLIYHNHRKLNKKLIKDYSNLFYQNGISLRYSWYYIIKHYLYRKIYPFYKSMKRNNN